tara:strand:- start:340 stop:603 length:264 start_codon:yes stop_codon:yes gene_type:complete
MSDFEVITQKKLVAEDKDHKYYLDVLDEVLLWMEQYVGDNKEGREALLNMSVILDVKSYIKRWQVVRERNAEDVAKRLSKAIFESEG